MKTVILCRHAEREAFFRTGGYDPESVGNQDRVWDDGLTEMGKDQARAVGASLNHQAKTRISEIRTSPFLRCVQTAVQIAVALDPVPEITIDPSWCEFLKHAWFGSVPFDDIYMNAADLSVAAGHPLKAAQTPLLPALTDYEPDEETRPKALAKALRRLLTEGPPTNSSILFVSHGGVLQHCVKQLCPGVDVGRAGFGHHCEVGLGGGEALELVRSFEAPTKYTPGCAWFRGHRDNWRNMLGELKGRPTVALEIGSFEGLSASWMLGNILTHEDSQLWCVDHFDSFDTGAGKRRLHRFLFNIRATEAMQKVTLLPYFSARLADLVIFRSNSPVFDFVYVDGSHRSDDTFLDAELAWRVLGLGGLMLFDDYEWPTRSDAHPCNPLSKDDVEHPKGGIDAFLAVHTHDMEVVHKGYQVLIRKRSEVRKGFPPTTQDVPVRALTGLKSRSEDTTDLENAVMDAMHSGQVVRL